MNHKQTTELNEAIQNFQNGNFEQAKNKLLELLKIAPQAIVVLELLGIVFAQEGDTSGALQYFEQITQMAPEYSIAWSNRGNALQSLGYLEEAIGSYDRAIQLNPTAIDWLNRGTALDQMGRWDDALLSYKKSLDLKSNEPQAWYNLGNTLDRMSRFEEASDAFKQATLIDPDFFDAWTNWAAVLNELKKYDDAIKCCKKALSIQPNFANAWFNLGNSYKRQAFYTHAISSYEKAIAVKPDLAEAFLELGNMYFELKQFDKAIASFKSALNKKEDFTEAYFNLGNAYYELREYTNAIASYDAAIKINPSYALAWANKGNVYGTIRAYQKAEDSYRESIRLDPNLLIAHSSLLFFMNYHCSSGAGYALEEARRYGQKVSEQASPKFTQWTDNIDPVRLKVGIVSGDLCNHPVGFFSEGLFENLSHSEFELFAFPTKRITDDLTERIKPFFTKWEPIHDLSDFEAASLIHDIGVHILIDLSGHSADNRLRVFSYKPAPVQATWLGYFATTGLPEMDYFLGDPYMAPHKEQNSFTETICNLRDIWLAQKPPNFHVSISELPAVSNGYITFGSFANLSKVNEQVIETWAKLLNRVPRSKLFLKSKQFTDEETVRRVCDEFSIHKVDKDRLIFDGPSPRKIYFDSYNKVDMVLDTFPYPGGTTTVDALWMGVPVLTMKGQRFLSRLGESLASNAGLHNWIACDSQDYVNKGVVASSNLSTLLKLRLSLREQVLKSPIFDVALFSKNFSSVLWDIWHRHTKKFI